MHPAYRRERWIQRLLRLTAIAGRMLARHPALRVIFPSAGVASARSSKTHGGEGEAAADGGCSEIEAEWAAAWRKPKALVGTSRGPPKEGAAKAEDREAGATLRLGMCPNHVPLTLETPLVHHTLHVCETSRKSTTGNAHIQSNTFHATILLERVPGYAHGSCLLLATDRPDGVLATALCGRLTSVPTGVRLLALSGVGEEHDMLHIASLRVDALFTVADPKLPGSREVFPGRCGWLQHRPVDHRRSQATRDPARLPLEVIGRVTRMIWRSPVPRLRELKTTAPKEDSGRVE